MALPTQKPTDIWSQLTPADAELLRGCLVARQVVAGQMFIWEGAPGDSLYLIQRGTVDVRRRGQVLATLGPGHAFGEMALLDGLPRNADVIANTDCDLLRLDAAYFSMLCQQVPNLRILLTHLVAHRLNWSGADMVARRVGPYEVVQQLGAGGMGWVFRVRRDGNSFALKMLPHPFVAQPNFQERYQQEARLLQQIRHPNVVEFYGLIELFGTLFLVLEYIPGRNAQEWVLQCGRPSTADVLTVTISVVKALQAAHSAGVLHCDLKPSNIMLSDTGVVKLVDFGIAASLSSTGKNAKLQMTPGYAAPERFEGERGGPEGDYYSLGITVYQLLTGELPFSAATLAEWKAAHCEHAAPSLAHHCPGAPAELVAFTAAALTKDPRQRADAIRPFLEQWSTAKLSRPVSRPPTPRALPSSATSPGADAETLTGTIVVPMVES